MALKRTSNSSQSYPKIANIDDQIIDKSNVLFDVFVCEEEFLHGELSKEHPILHLGEYEISKDNLGKLPERVIVRPHVEVQTITTTIPKQNFTISKENGSAVQINNEAVAVVTVELKEDETIYQIQALSNQTVMYWNNQKFSEINDDFQMGASLVIGGIVIERRRDQLKFTGITEEVKLDEWVFLEEKYQPEYPVDFPDYRRSPRIFRQLPKDKLAIQPPEPKDKESKSEIVKTVLPPLAMLGASFMTSSMSGGNPLMMLGMGGASALTTALSVSSYFTNKKESKENQKNRETFYQNYLLQKAGELEKLAKQQREAVNYHSPLMKELVAMVERYDARIYERTSNNADFLQFSLGIGDVIPSFEVDFSDDEREEDELRTFAKEQVVEPYKMLKNLPITTTLKGETIGLAGHYPVLQKAVSSSFFQTAVFHSYRDVEFLALVPEESYEKDWKHFRWLPHFQLQAFNLRGVIHNAQSRDMVLNSFYQLLNKRKQVLREAGGNTQEKVQFSPHYVLAILDDSWLAGHGMNEFLAEDMSQYGVTVIWGKEGKDMLPETVTTLIEYQSNESAELVNEKKVYVAKRFTPTHLPTQEKLEQAIQRLGNLNHVEVEKNAIPQAVTFLEMYDVKKVEELNVLSRWQQANTAKSLAVPLGLRGRDDLVELNLHERAHGPHGLVAGTTGSGKSEIVQSYVLSLAVHFSPEDVGFLPIDFKGGGMANEFKHLPHLLGSITNLDGASSARALASIRAELQKRQRFFSKYGVNHINGYTKLYKKGKETTDPEEKKTLPTEPLPHLFLISDEFAELKANEPDFMAELVSTARIGRSLGIHLILATQKPSGVVDDQIWSNSRFKLALKVADESDSNEIIKTPDAASIVEPGRAYLQVGNNEVYELFQSAWSGATYNPNATYEEKVDERIWFVNDLGQFELLTSDLSEEEEVHETSDIEPVSELTAIVDSIAEIAKETNARLPEKPWLPPLEEKIATPETNKEHTWEQERNLAVPFALLDIPSKQAQENFNFDFEKLSHTAIYGSAGFGKSTGLQTLVLNLARENNPEQVQFNLLDFGTNGLLPLKNLPHVVDIVRLEEEEKLIKFLKKIRQEIKHRKDVFAEVGVASLAQYEAKTGKPLTISVTVVDGYDPVRESELEESIETVLNQLLRDGASIGMYLVITGLRTDTFKISMTANLPTRMSLYLVEDGGMKDVVGQNAQIPQEIIGRGQIKLDEPTVMQVYLSAKGETDIERLQNIELEVNSMNESWTGERPKGIPMVEKVLTMTDFFDRQEVQDYLAKGNIPLGLDLETTDVVGFQPKEESYFLVADEMPTQNEFVERTLLASLPQLENVFEKKIVFDRAERFANRTDIFDAIVSEMDYSETASGILSEFSERMNDPEGTYESMFIYVPDVSYFGNNSYVSDDDFRKLIKNGSSVGIYLFFQADKNNLDVAFDEVSKMLRSAAPAGLVGSRLTEQGYIKVKTNYNEPAMEFDEHNYFANRKATRVKLPSEI